MIEPWVSVDDVARHLGIRKDSVYRWIEQRGLPALRIGKLWKLKLSEVDAWVREMGSEAPKTKTRARAKARPTILVIDDDRVVRETVSDFLGDEGFDVVLAADGAQALDLLATASPRPSLIVLDLKMPNVDGWEFRSQQALDPALAAIPVIVVTAVPSAKVQGAALVLPKPLKLPPLARGIREVLG